MSLGVLTAVLKRVEQLRINACQASEILSIYLIGFALVGVDEPHFTRIGYKDLMAALLEHSANPGRMSARLHGDSQWPLRGKAYPASLRSGAQPAFLDHFAAFFQCPANKDGCICLRDLSRPSSMASFCYHHPWADPPFRLGL